MHGQVSYFFWKGMPDHKRQLSFHGSGPSRRCITLVLFIQPTAIDGPRVCFGPLFLDWSSARGPFSCDANRIPTQWLSSPIE